MVAIASLLIIVTLALLITRIAAVALAATGLSIVATRIFPHDRLIIYGRSGQLGDLDCRCAGEEGDRLHALACGRTRESK